VESIAPDNLRTAVCDQEGFYPFRSLVTGHLTSREELALAERFARVVVLHDSIEMHAEPMPAQEDEDEWAPEQIAAGGRNVIVAFAPDLTPYGPLFTSTLGPDPLDTSKLQLSDRLRELAREMSGGEPGNVYYDAHLRYVFRLGQTLCRGGSIVCGGPVGVAMRECASEYPEALFAVLDADLQAFARQAHAAHLGVATPPILSVVLARVQSRDDIPAALCALREELKPARDRLWSLIDEMRSASNLAELRRIQSELERASALLSPGRTGLLVEPTRVLWNLLPPTVALGIAAATGGSLAGAAASAGAHLIRDLGMAAGNYLFGRGAFDLARRIRSELVARGVASDLTPLLSETERRVLLG
jgi:hypothetical protein